MVEMVSSFVPVCPPATTAGCRDATHAPDREQIDGPIGFAVDPNRLERLASQGSED